MKVRKKEGEIQIQVEIGSPHTNTHTHTTKHDRWQIWTEELNNKRGRERERGRGRGRERDYKIILGREHFKQRIMAKEKENKFT